MGEYPQLKLIFDCNGKLIDNTGVSDLRTADPWPHQKVGIKYKFSKHRNQIYYEKAEGNVIRRIPIQAYEELAEALAYVKKGTGGSFYVNEHGYVFAPVAEQEIGMPDLYVGQIDFDRWFEKFTGD